LSGIERRFAGKQAFEAVIFLKSITLLGFLHPDLKL
jgi:hypothetical protein